MERLNPVASTATEYLPTSRGVTTYSPDESDVVLTAILVPMLVIVTVAPATIAPLGSVTVPTIAPAVVWAPSGARHTTNETKITQTMRLAMLLCCLLVWVIIAQP